MLSATRSDCTGDRDLRVSGLEPLGRRSSCNTTGVVARLARGQVG